MKDKSATILKNLTDTLGGLRLGGKAGDEKLAKLDEGVLIIAMMIAAIDGQILPAEFAAFERMARKSRGFKNEDIRATAVRLSCDVGPILATAQFGVHTEAQRLSIFLALAENALPKGFAGGSLCDVRRAFALFVAMGVSDGAMSSLERAAIMELAKSIGSARAKKLKRAEPLLEPPFFLKAERIVKDLAVAAKRDAAEQALEELITRVETKGGALAHAREILV